MYRLDDERLDEAKCDVCQLGDHVCRHRTGRLERPERRFGSRSRLEVQGCQAGGQHIDGTSRAALRGSRSLAPLRRKVKQLLHNSLAPDDERRRIAAVGIVAKIFRGLPQQLGG